MKKINASLREAELMTMALNRYFMDCDPPIPFNLVLEAVRGHYPQFDFSFDDVAQLEVKERGL